MVQGPESVTLLFRLRTGSAELLEDKKRCRKVSDEKCVERGCGSFSGRLWGFERDRLVLLDDVYRIVGAREWLDEFWREDEEGKVALLLGKGVEGICNRVIGCGRVCIVLVG